VGVNWSKYGYDDDKKEQSVTRVNWQKYEPVSAEQFSAHMNAMPDLFNPYKVKESIQERFPPVRMESSRQDAADQRQQAAKDSTLGRLVQKGDNLITSAAERVNELLPGLRDSKANEELGNAALGAMDHRTNVQRAIANNPVGAFVQGAGDAATLGLTSFGERMLGNPDVADRFTQSEPGKAGQIAGQFVLPAGRVKAGASLLSNIGRGALAGTGLGAGIEAGEYLTGRNDQSLGQRALDAGISGAFGGVGAGVADLGGRALNALAGRMRSNNVPEEAVQEILALPAPRERGRANTALTDDVIMNADTTTRPQPLGLPAPEMIPSTTARIAQRQNPFRQQFEELAAEVQRRQVAGRITPGREMEEVESIWSQMAGREGVSFDELIQRAYPSTPNRITPDLVQRARDTQYARDVAGAPMPVRGQSDRFARPQGVLAQAEPPIERVGVNRLEPQKPKQPRPIESIAPQREIIPAPIREADEIVEAVNQPRVRDKVYSYLDEAEKSARERISKRRNRLSANPIDEWKDHAIVMAAKLGKGTIKAVDFTEELVKEFGEQVRPHAAKILRQSKAILKNQGAKTRKSIEDADTFNNSGKGDASTFDSKINRNVKKKTTPWQQKFDNIRSQFEDDVLHFERLEKNVTGSVASAEDSLYKAARMFKGAPERASQIVTERLTPIVKGIEKVGYSADDLGRYALARHAQDVNNAGYKSGFTNAEIKDVLEKYGTPEMEAAQQALVKVNRDMLQELVVNGVVSEDLAKVLNERWKNYIPLFRSFDDDKVEFTGGLSKALANVADPIVALKGSERAVIDPLENMVKNIMQSVNSAERNKVATQLSKLAQKDKEGQFIRKLDPNEKVGRKNVVTVRENGEAVKYEVEPEVYKTFLNMDQESSNMLVNILSKPASLLRAGATLTPEFSLRNPMRDVLQAFVTSESGFTPLDFASGLIQTIKRGGLYKEWIDNLGAYGNVMSQDRNVHRQALEKVLKEPPGKKFVNIVNPKQWLNVLRLISDTTESATKVGEYRAALRSGASKQEAAYRSRDLMDFARSGSSIRQTNRMVAFLNANIQGKSKLIRAIKANPKGTIARMVASTTIPTVGIFLINKNFANETQKQTIAEAPDWQKDTFWLLAIPGTDTVARIPKPFDIAPIFANLPERALDFAFNNDKQAFDGFARRVLGDAALPMQLSGLLPFIEGMADYSFFRESNIIPQREKGFQPRDQYDPIRTTETAKLLARGAEAVTGGITAGLGTYATSAIDSVLKGLNLVDRPAAPAKRVEQRPFAKAFLVDPLQSGKSLDKFYDEKEKLSSEKSSAEINQRPFTKSGRLDQLNTASESISKINTKVREIEKSDLTPKEKRERIDVLVKQRNTIAQKVMKSAR
jgi:hypothetical protein